MIHKVGSVDPGCSHGRRRRAARRHLAGGWLGLMPLATALFRICPAYLPFGLAPDRRRPATRERAWAGIWRATFEDGVADELRPVVRAQEQRRTMQADQA